MDLRTLRFAFIAPAAFLVVASGLSGCNKTEKIAYEVGEERPGGESSVNAKGRNAFSLPSGNMAITRRLDFSVGNSFFRNPWVAAPASTDARDGLGPLFNTNGCQNCHIKDGRGHAPNDGELNRVSMLVRLSIPTPEGKTLRPDQSVMPHPVYGGQLQDFTLPGGIAEGRVRVNYTYHDVQFSDSETVELRKPVITIEDLGYGPLSSDEYGDIMMSARIAPPMIGLGLLEAISENDILANADVNDENDDGISGKPNQVWDVEQQKTTLGRFGWKAGQPTLKQQNSGAFNGDMGLTTHLFMEENCTPDQTRCHELMAGEHPEVSDNILDKVTFYTRNLAVPVRPDAKDAKVLKGKQIFYDAGCASCHTPSFTVGADADAEQANQKIWPYTDMLLHDMGEGLADHRPEYLADDREWRTPPLWGIGHTHEVDETAGFLHDGRARTLMEAILWHDGEAANAKEQVLAMDASDRNAIIRFVESL
ncbi:di-heme oxidoredictase family protein [uncultured Endozoicomonas sp.]|uniref:di-heme oxidoreductase family protein n=1 Tax=uncultured Endozoicomonas sp. TaxID=432652 RepID=UPI00260A2F35|nr:di-heme oxidoredictase family protein [uncultured Endozoicomonas sp.]